MSKFIDAVKAEMTGDRRASMGPVTPMAPLEVIKEYEPVAGMYDLVVYRIGVSYTRTMTCRPADLINAQRNLIEELRHDLYGEFTKMLIDVERHIYGQEWREALAVISDIKKEIRG